MTPAHNFCTLLHLVTLACSLCAAQLNSRSWVNWAPLHGFAKSATFSECQRSILLAPDISRDFFHLHLAFFFGYLVVLVLLLGWPFYNSKSSKFNRSAIPFRRKRNRGLLVRLLITLSELPTPLLQWPDLVIVRAFVGTLFLLTKKRLLKLLPLKVVALLHQPPLCHVLLFPILLLKWPKFVLVVAFEPWLITVTFALSFLFPLTLTIFFVPHSTRKPFIEPLKKLKKL